jgi:lipopolysaccharide/colanic/teichoic acid biosynthesis glycosyltransferase
MELHNLNKQITLPEDTEAYLNRQKKYFFIKRIFDILFSILALFVLLPLLLATMIAIKLDSRGKVIFSQQRTGKNGKPFILYKFRSMYEGAELDREYLNDQNEMDGPVFKISKDPRMTKVGRVIRKYSIDELPQLINIIRGEMSIVGPRPLVLYETEKFTDYENKRHLVKPGLTCYWQIGGRNTLSFQEWIYLDLKYITEMSLKTDIKLIFKTIKVVVMKKGAF